MDTCICCRLRAVHEIGPRLTDLMSLFARYSRRLCHVLVERLNFLLFKSDLDSSQQIYHIRYGAEVHGHVIFNIKIKIRVQHINGHGRTAVTVRGIALLISSVRKVENCIAIDGDHPDLFRLIVQTCNNNGIRSVSFPEIPVSGVYPEESDIRISLSQIHVSGLNFLINNQILRLYIAGIDLAPLYSHIYGRRTEQAHHETGETHQGFLPVLQSGKPVFSF